MQHQYGGASRADLEEILTSMSVARYETDRLASQLVTRDLSLRDTGRSVYTGQMLSLQAGLGASSTDVLQTHRLLGEDTQGQAASQHLPATLASAAIDSDPSRFHIDSDLLVSAQVRQAAYNFSHFIVFIGSKEVYGNNCMLLLELLFVTVYLLVR